MQNLRAILLFFLFAPGDAAAAEINVVALTAGKAVLTVDGGKPQTLALGQVTPEGVKLISADSESVVIEFEGRRQTLGMGQRISLGGAGSGPQRATLTADAGGHFITVVAINGVSMKLVVDTGASLVTLGSTEAMRAGIRYRSGEKALLQTASGTVPAWRVKLDTVRVGDITLNNVDGVVVEGKAMGELGLLGLSFLNRLDMRREGATMTLTRRY